MSAARTIYRYLAALVFLAVVVQIGLAGYGAFHAIDVSDNATPPRDAVGNGFNSHVALGYALVLASVLLAAAAFAARVERRDRSWSVGLFALLVLQVALAGAGQAVAGLGALHAINALFVFAAAGILAHRAFRRTPAAA